MASTFFRFNTFTDQGRNNVATFQIEIASRTIQVDGQQISAVQEAEESRPSASKAFLVRK